MQTGVLDEVLTSDIIDDIHVPDMLDHGCDGHGDHEEYGLPREGLGERHLRKGEPRSRGDRTEVHFEEEEVSYIADDDP